MKVQYINPDRFRSGKPHTHIVRYRRKRNANGLWVNYGFKSESKLVAEQFCHDMRKLMPEHEFRILSI